LIIVLNHDFVKINKIYRIKRGKNLDNLENLMKIPVQTIKVQTV